VDAGSVNDTIFQEVRNGKEKERREYTPLVIACM
jgi:hypothetical protein